MKKLSKKDFNEVKTWIYRNARPLELAMWQNIFENGKQDAVLAALKFYQNDDGGFGNALEPDSWNPNSSPYATLYAINIIKNLNFIDLRHPILRGIIRFLENDSFCLDSGWLFNTSSNDKYAHAPWWGYDEQAIQVEHIGVTAEIAGFILKFIDNGSELYKKALRISNTFFEKLELQDHFDEMGINGYCVLLDSIQQAGLTHKYDYESLLKTIKRFVFDSIEKDTTKWVDYVAKPSNYIVSPQSIFYEDNKEIVSKELDYLIETKPADGVWNITWSWFDNNEKYAKEFAISENWWKGVKVLETIQFLKNFDRLEL